MFRHNLFLIVPIDQSIMRIIYLKGHLAHGNSQLENYCHGGDEEGGLAGPSLAMLK